MIFIYVVSKAFDLSFHCNFDFTIGTRKTLRGVMLLVPSRSKCLLIPSLACLVKIPTYLTIALLARGVANITLS